LDIVAAVHAERLSVLASSSPSQPSCGSGAAFHAEQRSPASLVVFFGASVVVVDVDAGLRARFRRFCFVLLFCLYSCGYHRALLYGMF
jgi:hypothetical protein